mgnify:CR=1 FL=1
MTPRKSKGISSQTIYHGKWIDTKKVIISEAKAKHNPSNKEQTNKESFAIPTQMNPKRKLRRAPK